MLPGSARPVAADNLHVTLAFLGSVDAETRDCLESCAGEIRAAPLTLRLDRCGWFRRAQVIWLGAEEEPPAILALAAALRECQLRCGLDPESRPFQSHLTLARRARRPPRVRTVPPLEWPVDEFCLVASDTRPEGAVYEVLHRWPLRPA